MYESNVVGLAAWVDLKRELWGPSHRSGTVGPLSRHRWTPLLLLHARQSTWSGPVSRIPTRDERAAAP